jgi:predicted phosphodiesterase
MDIAVAIPDAHYPHHIDTKAFEKYLHDLQPTHLVFLGDTWDLGLISHWDHQEKLKEMGLKAIREGLQREAAGLRQYIKDLVKACGPRLRHVIYMEGNHEAWLRQYQATYGNAGEPLTLQAFLQHCGITKFISQGDCYAIGKLRYIHGDNYSGGNLGAICKKMVDDYEACVVFGHFHGIAEASKASVVTAESKKFAKCVGTMGKLNPRYIRNKPHQWQNAFHVAFFLEDGFFNDYVVRIIKGRFAAPNGKVYR